MQRVKMFVTTAFTTHTNHGHMTWLCRLRTLVMGLVLQSGIAAAQNLATNPGFETGDTTGWFGFGPCTISAETNYVHSGSYAALVTNRTAFWNGIAQLFAGVLQSGQTYNLSTWLLLAGGSNQTVQLVMQKVDDSGISYAVIATDTLSTNGWTQFSGQYTFNPSGTVTALRFYAQVSSSSNAAYYIDDLVVQPLNATNGQCTVDWTNVFQPIDGFGASSAWTAPSLSDAQADMFFSASNGIGLSLLRNRVAPDGTTSEAVTMQKAQARGARVWTTPMSPPAAYKDSGTVNGGNFLSAYNQPYANQLANYVLNMKTNYGVNLYAISVQNEPNYSTTNYESCIWTGQQIHDFLPYLYNALSNNGVASTKIMIAESATWNLDMTANSMNDVTTSNMVGVLAAHDYDYSVSPLNSYGKPLWETEISSFDAFDGSITNGLYWASQIHAFMTVAEANAWHFYWLIPYDPGAPENMALTDDAGNPTKRMYVLGQYSRFVRPGYYRIGVSNGIATSISAYKDPDSGNFAIVAINHNNWDFAQTINLNGFAATNVTPWITSGSLSLASQPTVGVTNSTFVYTLPAMSVVTFVGKANATVPTLAINRNGSQVGLTVSGDAGWNYTLLTSTNLSNWQPLLLTNPTVMPLTWSDTNSIADTRFYRVQLGR